MSDNIEMKPINKEENSDTIKDSMLAEDKDVIIWYNDDQDERSIFINVGNATMSMPEPVYYMLTKLTQIAAKKLLEID